jgi:transposase
MPQLSQETRFRIILFHYMGFNWEEIAEASSCDWRTVVKWIQRFELNGNVNALQRSGRRRVTTPDNDIDIAASINSNLFYLQSILRMSSH